MEFLLFPKRARRPTLVHDVSRMTDFAMPGARVAG